MSRLLSATLLFCIACDATDLDGDGFAAPLDCDDRAANIHPDATEIRGNGLDEDCDGADRAQLRYVGGWTVDVEVDGMAGDLDLDIRSNQTLSMRLEVESEGLAMGFDGVGILFATTDEDFQFEADGQMLHPDFGGLPMVSEGSCVHDGERLHCTVDILVADELVLGFEGVAQSVD